MGKELLKIRINHLLLWMYSICAVTGVWIAGFIRISTNKVIYQFAAREFLARIPAIPGDTKLLFYKVVWYLLLLGGSFLLRVWVKENFKWVLATLVLDFFVCLRIITLLDFNYNGVLLWVFANMLIYLLKTKYSLALIFFGIFTYIFTDKNLVSMWIKTYRVAEYISIYDKDKQTYLYLTYNILNMTTMIVFFVCCIFIIVKKDETIKKANELYEKLSLANSNLKKVNKELENMVRENEELIAIRERNRIAREIHDSMGHTLTGLIAGIDACIALAKDAPQILRERLESLSEVSRKGMADIRASVSSLRPDALERESLNTALSQLIKNSTRVMGVEIEYMCNHHTLKFDEDEENAIYRIVQESLTNATRHGKATKIQVVMEYRQGEVYLKISDNGMGSGYIEEGFGLHHIRERVEMLNGKVKFYSEDGFVVEAVVPIRWGGEYD